MTVSSQITFISCVYFATNIILFNIDGDKISLMDLKEKLISTCEKHPNQPPVITKAVPEIAVSGKPSNKRKATDSLNTSSEQSTLSMPNSKSLVSNTKRNRSTTQIISEEMIESRPFIQDIDLVEELIVVSNPSSAVRDISGWKISDDHGRNKFVFPAGTTVAAKGVLNVYCCAKDKDLNALKNPYIFWTNKNGGPRMKNVLNDGIFIFTCIGIYITLTIKYIIRWR